jgi:hypothetical protein
MGYIIWVQIRRCNRVMFECAKREGGAILAMTRDRKVWELLPEGVLLTYKAEYGQDHNIGCRV